VTARIFFKLIFAVLLVMVVAFATLDYLGSRMVEQAFVDLLTREMAEKAQMLAAGGSTPAQARIHELAAAAGMRVTVVRRDGVVTADSEAEPARMENHAGRPEIRQALSGSRGVSVRPSPTLGVDFLYVATPLADGGALRLAMPLRHVRLQLEKIRLGLIGYMALAFLPAILLAGLFARHFSRKLGAVIDYASTLATGNFRARLEPAGNDEFGVLARQLNETGIKLQKMFEELQREHQELERMESIRKDFVSNVSHELRTPLASIQGYAETLIDGAIHDEENNLRFLEIIRKNAERLTRLTADLLILSRVEMKTQRFQFASYDLGTLIADCCDSLRPIAGKKKIAIETEPPPPGSEVFGDKVSMQQILNNLLDNAIKYTPEGGRVLVSSRIIPGQGSRPDMAEIGVTDNGIGIPAADIPRLFERFYRVDKARSRELGGTGLGLAIVKHLTRAHGGDVSVESAPNQGSTFRFTLPTRDIGMPDSATLQPQLTVL